MLPSVQAQSTHPDLLTVIRCPGEYTSYLVIQKSFRKGEIICPIEGVTKGRKAYSSVQTGANEDDHIELNSDLLYVNHSCEPNVCFNVSSSDAKDWHMAAVQDINEGDTLCFFYPSTEWDMASPFECNCASKTCLGTIQGASYLSREQLQGRGFINAHVMELFAKSESQKGVIN